MNRRPAPPALTREIAASCAGGVLGAFARYGVGVWFDDPAGAFPVATLFENLTGSLVLGAVVMILIAREASADVRAFVAVGILGSYTTFSSFSVEFWELIRADRAGMAIGYVAVSLAGGILAVWIGVRLGSLVKAKAR